MGLNLRVLRLIDRMRKIAFGPGTARVVVSSDKPSSSGQSNIPESRLGQFMARAEKYKDPEDMFAETRMSFGEHIEELRYYLLRGIVGFVIAVFLSFAIGKEVLYGFFVYPVEQQLGDYYEAVQKKHEAKALKEIRADPSHKAHKAVVTKLQFLKNPKVGEGVDDPSKIPEEEWVTTIVRVLDPVELVNALSPSQRLLAPRPSFKTFGVTEAFLVYFKVCLLCGLVIGSPWIFWQVWMFIAAGLYPQEKRLVHVYMPISLVLFLLGAVSCQFVVLPKAVSALLWFNDWLGFEPDLRLNEWLSFAIILPVVFGLSFETPLVMLFLERLGVMTVESYRAKRRIAFFVLAVISAMNPGLDAFSMLFQWVALCLLYELGIWLCIWSPQQPAFEGDVPEPDELVEV
jgi:sec-independent protein translocase protein TatC